MPLVVPSGGYLMDIGREISYGGGDSKIHKFVVCSLVRI